MGAEHARVVCVLERGDLDIRVHSAHKSPLSLDLYSIVCPLQHGIEYALGVGHPIAGAASLSARSVCCRFTR